MHYKVSTTGLLAPKYTSLEIHNTQVRKGGLLLANSR